MATQYRTLTYTTASVNAGDSLTRSDTIVGNRVDLAKIKVVPSVSGAGENTKVEIFKRDTFSSTDLCYATNNFVGSLIDPIQNDGITTTERNEGYVARYEDLDNTSELHLKVHNNGTVARTFTVTILYTTPQAEPYDVTSYGAVGDGSTDDSAAITAAITACDGTGILFFPAGKTFRITSDVVCDTHVMGIGATILSDGGFFALGSVTSGETIERKTCFLPEIVNNIARATAWADTNSMGLRVSNCQGWEIHVPYIVNFRDGLAVRGNNALCGNNHFFIGTIYNCKRGIFATQGAADTGCASNSNWYWGGEIVYDSAIGTNVSGVRSIMLEDFAGASNEPPNNNTFMGQNVEGDVQEYMVEVQGNTNMFYNIRWEGTTPKILFSGSDADYNQVIGGERVYLLVGTESGGAVRNTISGSGRDSRTVTGSSIDQVSIKATSNGNPVRTIYLSDADLMGVPPATTWVKQETSSGTSMKATGDTWPRIYAEHSTGRIYFGDGTTNPTLNEYLAHNRFASGTWTPTLTGIANIDTVAQVGTASYMRIGDTVMASVQLDIDPTAGAPTVTRVGISLPVASNLGSLSGTAHSASTGVSGAVFQDTVNDRAELYFSANFTTVNTFYMTFMYRVA